MKSSAHRRDRGTHDVYEIWLSEAFKPWHCSGETRAPARCPREIYRPCTRFARCLSQCRPGPLALRARHRSCCYCCHSLFDAFDHLRQNRIHRRSLSHWINQECLRHREAYRRIRETRFHSCLHSRESKYSCEAKKFNH
jgi:hypothetical protein